MKEETVKEIERKMINQEKKIDRALELFVKLENAYGSESETGKIIREMICYLTSK